METLTIKIENKRNGASKEIDATDMSHNDFMKTCKAYAVNFDVSFVRIVR